MPTPIIITVPAAWKHLLGIEAFDPIHPPVKYGEFLRGDDLLKHLVSEHPWRNDHRVVKRTVGNRQYMAILQSNDTSYYVTIEIYEKDEAAIDFNGAKTINSPNDNVIYDIPCTHVTSRENEEEIEIQIEAEEEVPENKPLTQPPTNVILESPDAWEQIGCEGKPDTRLLSTTQIFGVHFHVEAIEVDKDDRAVTLEGQGILDDMYRLDEEGNFQTIQPFDNERTFVLVIYPFKK